jgi:hypothetical protein
MPVLGLAGRRRALVICNGTFDDGSGMKNVRGVPRDHDEVVRVLRSPEAGFEVTALLDRGLVEIRRSIAEVCAASEADDLLLLYYSGTSRLGPEGYLYLGARDSTAQFLSATMLEAEFVLREVCRSAARRTVFLLDTCHAGAFFNHNRGIPNGLYAITACDAHEETPDTPDGGVFTRALVAGIESADADRDGDGKISIDELHEHILEKLRDDGYQARPQKWVWNVREPIHVAAAPPRVFLSYAREDLALAQVVKAGIEARGLSVWFDLEGIVAGDWTKRVTSGLNEARAMVVLLTPASFRSDPVQKELAFAEAKRVPILPVSTVDYDTDQLPDWYVYRHESLHRRVIGDATRSIDIDELVRAIRSVRKPPRGE